jgi:hypothetical protein
MEASSQKICTEQFQRSLFAFGAHNLAAAIETIRADVMTQMHLTGGRLNGQRRVGQEVVRTVHTTLGRGFFILLNSHFNTPIKNSIFLFQCS